LGVAGQRAAGQALAERGISQRSIWEVYVRIGNLDGRLVILTGASAIDVEEVSAGRFGPDPQAVYQRWAEFTSWAPAAQDAEPVLYDSELLGAPAPAPRQSFGIGLNYRDHADESGFGVPEQPSVFTKFPSCITGPYGDVVLPPGGHTDWEVELVAVIGTEAWHADPDAGWSYVAGLCVGQVQHHGDRREIVGRQAAGWAADFETDAIRQVARDVEVVPHILEIHRSRERSGDFRLARHGQP